MIFDTDVLIWFFRGNVTAAEFLEKQTDREVSIVTIMELYQGSRTRDESRVIRRFFQDNAFRIIPINEAISHLAVTLIEDHARSNGLQVANARASQWTDRYRSFNGGDPGAFDFMQYRSNTVVRWEYRPGSALFLVWAQERTQSLDGGEARAAANGLGQLYRAHPANVFLVKGSYWISY